MYVDFFNWWCKPQVVRTTITHTHSFSMKFMSTHSTLCLITRGCGTRLTEQAVTGSRTSMRRVQRLKKLNREVQYSHQHTQFLNEVHVNLLDPMPYHKRLRDPFKGAGRDGIQDKHATVQQLKRLSLVKFMSTQLTLCPITRDCGTHLREQAVTGSRTSK